MSSICGRGKIWRELACWAAGLVVALVCGGCQTMPPSLVSCPLPAVEQASRIEELVPLGTTREEAISRLKKEGIAGNFGEADSIFYCDIWNRSDSERWHINVALLFDDDGKLYALRPDPHAQGAATDTPATAISKKIKDVTAPRHTGLSDPFAE
jgi:hypothetical protein